MNQTGTDKATEVLIAELTRELPDMNNCYSNYGSTNARELASILADLSHPAED